MPKLPNVPSLVKLCEVLWGLRHANWDWVSYVMLGMYTRDLKVGRPSIVATAHTHTSGIDYVFVADNYILSQDLFVMY